MDYPLQYIWNVAQRNEIYKRKTSGGLPKWCVVQIPMIMFYETPCDQCFIQLPHKPNKQNTYRKQYIIIMYMYVYGRIVTKKEHTKRMSQ